jgi:hypothetical protein
MPQLLLKNAKFVIDSVDLSDHVKQVGITYSAAALDNTAMGDNTKTSLGGLFDWPVSLDLYQDYGADSVDATLFPLVGTVVALQINPVNAANGASNPAYEGNVLVESYEPVSGSVGQLAMTKVSLKPAGDLSRVTA